MNAKQINFGCSDFLANVYRSFNALQGCDLFTDVTLVSNDNKKIQAHKLILSVGSEYFRDILSDKSHQHPMLCLDGVFSDDLEWIIQYLYTGEVSVPQSSLQKFLNIANKLKCFGLIEVDHHGTEIYPKTNTEKNDLEPAEEPKMVNFDIMSKDDSIEKTIEENSLMLDEKTLHDDEKEQANRKLNDFLDKEEFETKDKIQKVESHIPAPAPTTVKVKLKQLIEPEPEPTIEHMITSPLSEPTITEAGISCKPSAMPTLSEHDTSFFNFDKLTSKLECKICNIQFTHRSNANCHYKTTHLGMRFPCNNCEYKATTKNALKRHKESLHLSEKEQCSFCGKKFSRDYLKLHIQHLHETSAKIHYCSECSYHTKRKDSLKEHYEFYHLKIFKHMCSQCDYKALKIDHLKQHEKKIHT